MKRKRHKHSNTTNQNPAEEAQSTLHSIYAWWQGVSTRQRVALIACALLVMASVAGLTFALANRTRRQSSSSDSVSPRTDFFATPKEKCLPLVHKPRSLFPNRDKEFTTIENHENGWRKSLHFSFDPSLLDETSGYTNKELRHKLRELKVAFRKMQLNEFQEAALHGTHVRLVRSSNIFGALAMVEPGSGDIFISTELDPETYAITLQNELSHVEIRYANLKRCGVELPEDRLQVLQPFMNDDWTVNATLRTKLKAAMRKGDLKVKAYLILYGRKTVTDPRESALLNDGSRALTTGYNLLLPDAVAKFAHAYDQQSDAGAVGNAIGGNDHALTEEVSSINMYPSAVRNFFYQAVTQYLEEYYALSCDYQTAKVVSM